MLALVLYGYTIRLPFFLDDGPVFSFLNQMNGLQFWSGYGGFPYYRPVAFTLWKLAAALPGGRFDPALMHLVNVFCFGLIGVVTGLLAGRFAPSGLKWRFTLLAGLGVILFPFNYQAVTQVAALFHLTMALGFTLSLWAATRWLDGRGGRTALALCWSAAFFGIFSHENGPLLLPLCVGMIAFVYGRRSLLRLRTALVIIPIGGMALAYLLLWITLPFGHGTLQLSAEPVRAFADLSEGLIYPLDMAARPFVQGDATNALIVTLLAVTLIVGLAIARSRMAVYGIGWYFLAVIPSALLLAPGYVLGSPRLMLLASVGTALFWAAIVARLWTFRRLRWATAFCIVTVISLSGVFFLDRAYDFQRMGDYLWRLADLSQALQSAGSNQLLVINPPNFLAPLQPNRRFLLSAEGATVMVDSYSYAQQVWLNTGKPAPRVDAIGSRIAFHPPADRLYLPSQPFVDGQPLYDRLHKTPELIATEFDGNSFWPVFVGGPDIAGPNVTLATFENIELLQAEAYFSPADRLVTVKLRWRLPEATPEQPFVHVFCNADFIGQADFAPWGGNYPLKVWQPGETQSEFRQIWLQAPATEDCLRIQLGVYYESNAQRLKLTDAQQTTYSDDLYPVPLKGVSSSLIPGK